jgi:hypothetical protein
MTFVMDSVKLLPRYLTYLENGQNNISLTNGYVEKSVVVKPTVILSTTTNPLSQNISSFIVIGFIYLYMLKRPEEILLD